MARQPIDDKTHTLRERGCLNAHPEHVRDEMFLSNAFFDPRDLLQVKYEMLRRVREEGEPVSAAATRFGLSRPTFYTAQRAYETGGLPALVPAPPWGLDERTSSARRWSRRSARRGSGDHRRVPESWWNWCASGSGSRCTGAASTAFWHGKKNARERRAPPQRAGAAGPLRHQLRTIARSGRMRRGRAGPGGARGSGTTGYRSLAGCPRHAARGGGRRHAASPGAVAGRRGNARGRHPVDDGPPAHDGEGRHETKSIARWTADHLSRDAYLYVRQSTVRQVYENTESTRRQYALRERAVALGWPAERVVVIDTDLGQSGADRDRDGFQRLVAEVGMGRAGIVLGLEVSRLARNSTDWHRLLEISALSDTLILDEDGVYDPGDFNDRLLLGLKGTMSEAELHMLHARLRGGLLNQARRGALKVPLPVGLVYDPLDRVALDPDAQVQRSPADAVRHLRPHRLCDRHGAALPRRGAALPPPPPRRGAQGRTALAAAGALARPCRCCTIRAMRGPTRSGAADSGVARAAASSGGACPSASGRSCCGTRIPATSHGIASRPINGIYATTRWPTARTVAAGQPARGRRCCRGLALCGVCGRGMTVRYHTRRGRQVPDYVCQRDGIQTAGAKCQSIPGAGVDRAVGALLVELMTPVTLTVALKVQDELAARADEVDVWRAESVERAREEAELARRRFMQAHPDNRLVADVLEAEWNARLRALDDARRELEQRRAEGPRTTRRRPAPTHPVPGHRLSRACGTIRRPRTASASAWRGC